MHQGWMFSQPFEIGLLPVLRHEPGPALAHRRERRLGQRLGVDVPLVGQPRLDDRVGAVAVRHRMRMRLDFWRAAPRSAIIATMRLRASKRSEAVERGEQCAAIRDRCVRSLEKSEIAFQRDGASRPRY